MKLISNKEIKAQRLNYTALEDRHEELRERIKKERQAGLKQVRNLEDKLEAITTERDALLELKHKASDLHRREIDLDTRDTVIKAKEAAMKTFDAELAELRTKAEAAREEGHKAGYADGVADGLREANKITADDRKMMAQIAALAAASHTPEAASKLADKVLTDVTKQLSAGK